MARFRGAKTLQKFAAVLPRFKNQCGEACVATLNTTIGPLAGLTIE